jgi:hypothetical protein
MSATEKYWKIWEFIRDFFPFQLIKAHLKFNFFALIFWSLLFLIVNDSLGYAFGVPLLFLSPEYLGTVSVWSFMIVGFSIGGFVMGFNTYSYMQLGPHFPFMASLSKPFLKFCLNNALIPLIFVGFMIYRILEFQIYHELAGVFTSLLFAFGLLAGIFVFLTLSFLYFFRVGKSSQTQAKEESPGEPISSVIHKHRKWYDRILRKEENTSLYIGKGLKIYRSRSTKHLDRETIEHVYARNRVSSSLYEILTILTFFILGAFHGSTYFVVPAAASIILLLTIFHMIFSALHSWLRGWVYPVMICTLFVMNFLSQRTDMFKYTNYLYGLDYAGAQKEEYTIDRIQSLANNQKLVDTSRENYVAMLEAWKKNTGQEKPKLIILNVSGGGSRSALWTMCVLQKTDSILEGRLGQHIQMITGASGGMIGAAYFRELYLREQLGSIQNLYDPAYADDMGEDLLNKLSFLASTNDLFIRYQKYEYQGQSYTKDRGYGFEEQLHENTNHLLEHSLGYYTPYEKKGMIPTMIFSPTIINDGRRMLIASQPVNFLTTPWRAASNMNLSHENIDFQSFFAHQHTDKVRFSSVLRSSATFPFVMPMVTLPSEPEIQLMDAGIRDNYGIKTSVEFLYAMQDWIRENTSGVVILQIRDTQKILDNEAYTQVSFMDKITLPFGNMYKNFPRVQDFNGEELLMMSAQSFDFPVDLISFNLRERTEDRISLSWHLTAREKMRIKEAFYSKKNQTSLLQLQRIL